MDSNASIRGKHTFYRSSQKKLAKAQRKLQHKQTGSAGDYKQQKKIAKIHRKSANQRKDDLHKRSTGMANQYTLACAKDLNLRAMSNCVFGNRKETLDNGYGMFEYKLKDRGKTLQKIGKWFPSSQICSQCGNRKKLVLSKRRFLCECRNIQDRVYNAAVHIKKEGYRIDL